MAGSAQLDAALQVKMIEDLITKQVNAIVISPNEPTSVIDLINDGMSKGILMMTFDSDSPDSDRVMYIGTDNKTAGQVQGETMREALGGSGKIGIITGGLGALNLNERIEGFRETVDPTLRSSKSSPPTTTCRRDSASVRHCYARTRT